MKASPTVLIHVRPQKTKRVRVWVSKSLARAVARGARRAKVSRAEFIRRAIQARLPLLEAALARKGGGR